MSEQEILPVGDIVNHFDPNPMIRKHGRGPEGKTCGTTCRTCRHLVLTSPTGNRTYWKCDRYSLSRSDTSDFRKKWAACRLYEVMP